MSEKKIIITTINPKTKGVQKFSTQLPNWDILLVGDKKSQHIDKENNIDFISWEEQQNLSFRSISVTPDNHYCRKNMGYLQAMSQGAEVIYDTDDDNIPHDIWSEPDFVHDESIYSKDSEYINIYSLYSDKRVWPRGFPLDEVLKPTSIQEKKEQVAIGVWQGLADNDPDVDAIYRLVYGEEIVFDKTEKKYALKKDMYCPFNSQNTFWRQEVFPLLYLPSTVSFRYTDILRGYVAQKLMWHHGYQLGFLPATVFQERNDHDLMKDFAQEIECYTEIKHLVSILDTVELGDDMPSNLLLAYTALKEAGIVKSEEITRVEAWVHDLQNLE